MKFEVTPALYSAYKEAISTAEWDDLLKPQSKINIESFHYKRIPAAPAPNTTHKFYLIYSPDRSSTIDDPYIAQIPPVKGDAGIMTFIATRGSPPEGWYILGRTYEEVWSDPEKLALYNSLVPPDQDGKPKAFGFFAGRENEMAGDAGRALFAPTTRDADILDFSWKAMKGAAH